MWRQACGYGVWSILSGSRVRAGSRSWRRRASSRAARDSFWIRLLRLPTLLSYGSGSTHTRRLPLWFSSRITFATSTCSCAATVSQHSARASSFERTSPRPSWISLSPAAVFRAGSSPFRMAAAGTRRRYGSPSSALVFADALTAPGGELRVWASPSHKERALPALRALLKLPFERVIVSHGEPVHTRGAYERALELAPWGG